MMLKALRARDSYSLTRRVVLLSSIWAIIATVALGWTLVGLFKTSVNQSFEELQLAQLYTLIAAVDATEDGILRGAPDLGDSNFQRADSGWFWRVFERGNSANALQSSAYSATTMDPPSLEMAPLDDQFSRRFVLEDDRGNLTRVLETEILLRDSVVAVFQVGGSETGFRETIGSYTRQVASLLGTFAIGLVVINMLVILYGLRPLERLRGALSDIRSGKTDILEGRYPEEIEPLADELNLLIDNNRRIVERSRTQVGDLAHSLKTPLSVLINDAEAPQGPSSHIVREQASAMQYQIQHYLNRARIAAQRESVIYRTDAPAATQKLVSVLAKLNPDKEIAYNPPNRPVIFAGEKEDYDEVVGNLLENACKWAKSTIVLTLDNKSDPQSGNNRELFTLTIADDGPGIEKQKRADALKRGQRMDETVPGTGLGLSIVAETVRSYGGDISLHTAQMGGLEVRVRLPSLRD